MKHENPVILDLLAWLLKQIDLDPKRPRFWTLTTLAVIFVAFALMTHWWATVTTLLIAGIIWKQTSKPRHDYRENAIAETISHIERLTVRLLDEHPEGIPTGALLKAAVVAMETNHWTAGQPWGIILHAQERILSPMLASQKITKVTKPMILPNTGRIEKVAMYVKTTCLDEMRPNPTSSQGLAHESQAMPLLQ